jgi:transcriptional regulator with XRE-family HTH domain
MSQRRAGNGTPPFGRYVKQAIANAGFRSPTAFARATGRDPSVVLRWISGQTRPEAATLAEVAPTLKVSSAELIRAAYPDLPDYEPPPEPDPEPSPVPDGPADPPAVPVVEDELFTLAGLHGWLHRLEPAVQAAMLHRSTLGFDARFDIVNRARDRAIAQLRDNWLWMAEQILAAGGAVDVDTWPGWLEPPPLVEQIRKGGEAPDR